jgi:hypothetical protein
VEDGEALVRLVYAEALAAAGEARAAADVLARAAHRLHERGRTPSRGPEWRREQLPSAASPMHARTLALAAELAAAPDPANPLLGSGLDWPAMSPRAARGPPAFVAVLAELAGLCAEGLPAALGPPGPGDVHGGDGGWGLRESRPTGQL